MVLASLLAALSLISDDPRPADDAGPYVGFGQICAAYPDDTPLECRMIMNNVAWPDRESCMAAMLGSRLWLLERAAVVWPDWHVTVRVTCVPYYEVADVIPS